MSTRCPAWCDRILISPAARKLIDDERENGKTSGMTTAAATSSAKGTYGIMGEVVCMGDHKVGSMEVGVILAEIGPLFALGLAKCSKLCLKRIKE